MTSEGPASDHCAPFLSISRPTIGEGGLSAGGLMGLLGLLELQQREHEVL